MWFDFFFPIPTLHNRMADLRKANISKFPILRYLPQRGRLDLTTKSTTRMWNQGGYLDPSDLRELPAANNSKCWRETPKPGLNHLLYCKHECLVRAMLQCRPLFLLPSSLRFALRRVCNPSGARRSSNSVQQNKMTLSKNNRVLENREGDGSLQLLYF